MIKISTEKYSIAKLIFLLYVILSFLFFIQIIKLWEFRKFVYNIDAEFDFYFLRYLFVTLIVLINILMLSIVKISNFIYSVLIVLFVLLLIPSSLLFASFKNINGFIFFSHNLFFYFLILACMTKVRIPIRKFGNKSSFKLLLLITIIGLIPYIKYIPHINFKNLMLKEIYETRALFGEIGDAYLGFTYSWFNKIIIPSVLVFAIFYKQTKIIVLSLLMLIFLYLVGAHKSVLIGIGAVLIAYRLSYMQFARYFLKLVLYLTIACLVLFVFFDYPYLTIYTIRRGLFVPALLDVAYFDFFNNDYLYWSESILRGIVPRKYDNLHVFLIGDTYFNKPDMGANNGIISDGFMNAGMIGVIINTTIISAYFGIINSLNISNKFFGLFLLLIILIISASLTTILLTHGAIILFLLSMFFLKDTKEEFDN